MSMQNRLFPLLVIISLCIYFALAFDTLPFFRGTAPYPPEWQWPYQASNTLSKIWFPLLISGMIVMLGAFTEKYPLLRKKPKVLISLVIILGILLQISILYYSRAGIGVLLHRILDPEITSYFAASTHISSVSEFLKTFNSIYSTLPLYAGYHPPFATLIFTVITSISQVLSPLVSFIADLKPTEPDVALLWSSLSVEQKIAALISPFVIMLLSMISIVPLFYTIKNLHNEKSAARAILLFICIPSLILFIPMNDVFMPLFTAISLYFFSKGLKQNSKYSFFVSGLVLSLGSLFSLTFIPILLFYIVYGALELLRTKKGLDHLLAPVTSFSFGYLLMPYLLFLFFGYNFFETIIKLLSHHAAVEHLKRYSLGLFYAPFDFFLFLGVPILVLLISTLFSLFRNKAAQTNGTMTIAFWIFLFAITVSGSVRFESARIWTPFIPLALVVTVSAMKNTKLSTQQFLVVLLLVIIQTIIFQTVLVTVW